MRINKLDTKMMMWNAAQENCSTKNPDDNKVIHNYSITVDILITQSVRMYLGSVLISVEGANKKDIVKERFYSERRVVN